MTQNRHILLVYSKGDDQQTESGINGWVTTFYKYFSLLLSQITKDEPEIKLIEANKCTTSHLENALAVLVVITPSLIDQIRFSNMLGGWAQLLKESSNLEADGISRIFKILKTPFDADGHLPELADIISYEMYYVDVETGEAKEFRRYFGMEAERGYWMKMVDIAYDITHLLTVSTKSNKKTEKKIANRDKTVYLASTGIDLLIQRDIIKRELRRHGYDVLPSYTLPKSEEDLINSVKEDLTKCRLSIHLIGEDYGYKLSGSEKSVVDIQNSIAQEYTETMVAYNQKSSDPKLFSRLIWLSPDLKNVSERQRLFIEDIKGGAAKLEEAEVLQIQLQELKSIIKEELLTGGRLAFKQREISGYVEENVAIDKKIIYLITDKEDEVYCKGLKDYLSKSGYKVLSPAFEGDLADIRYIHNENLKRCDGSIIFYGNTTNDWIHTKLSDLLKAPGLGRYKPLQAKAIYLTGKKNIDIDYFVKNKTLVLGNNGDFVPEHLDPFIAKLKD